MPPRAPALFAALCLALASARASGSVSEPLRVLFLGDAGHHRPADRARGLAPAFAARGIAVDYTEDLSSLTRERLAPYDALLLYANVDALPKPLEESLLAWIESGRGFVPVHCASYCFRNSDAFVRLVGGQFVRHGAGDLVARVVDPFHPAMAGQADVATWDETYEHAFPAADRHVLMARDGAGGRLEPVTWTRTHGAGRVFYTALGHDERTWTNAAFLDLLESGIRWAAAAPPPLEYAEDAAGSVPTYAPGAPWGTAGEPLRKRQLPLAPRDSMRHMTLARGFDVALFAAEPDLGGKPIDLAFDARGRLFLAETTDYPNEIGTGRDRIRICEDTDGDGAADRFAVFAEGLSIPTSLCFAAGGLVVAQAPDVLFLADTDGDDRADVRKTLFTGFGVADTHAGPSHFRVGLDGWVWGTVGYSGFDGVVGGRAHRFGQGIFRFRPDGSELEFLASTSNNTWGLGFGETGEVFASTANGEHSVFLAIPNRVFEAAPGLDGRGLARITDHDRIRPATPHVRQVDYHGGFTAAAGHAIYTGRLFPEEYWNRVAFVCEPTGHVVHMCRLEESGSGYVGRDFGNLLESTDEWTAPVAAEVGPDGAVWVLDWYNYIVQHNPTPEGFSTGKGNAYETPLRDKTRARIYRIAPRPKMVPGTISTETVPGTVSGMWAEWRRGELTEAEVVAALTDVGAGAAVRRNAAALLPRTETAAAALLDSGLISDADAKVRLATALALAEMPPVPKAGAAILDALGDKGNAADKFIPVALVAAAVRHDADFLRAALARGTAAAAAASPAEKRPPPRRLAPADFQATVYGGEARHARDASALSITASAPAGADASWSARVPVRPGRAYRLRARIRTEAVASGSGQGALLNVHELQGADFRVVTAAVTGSSAWTPVEVVFEPGDRTFVTVNCLFGGWGRSTGTAHYEGVEIEEIGEASFGAGPVADALRLATARLARRGDIGAIEPVLVELASAEISVAAAVLRGLAAGWPEGESPLRDRFLADLAASLPNLDAAVRRPYLALLVRWGHAERFREALASEASALLSRLSDPTLGPAAAREALLLDDRSATASAILEAAQSLPDEPAAELVRALDASREQSTPIALAECLGGLRPAAQRAAIDLLARRPSSAARLLDAIEAGLADREAIALEQWDAIERLPDESLAARAAAMRAAAPPDARKKAIDSLLASDLSRKSNPARGRAVFEANCVTCHRFDGRGATVGPDLSNIGARPRRDLLLDILEPNRSVEGNYRLVVVATTDEIVISGRLDGESQTTIALLDTTGRRHVIPRSEIATLAVSPSSLMPEGFEALGEGDLLSLLEYLGSNGGGAAK